MRFLACAALLIAGCQTAASFSSLQASFSSLQDLRQRCATAADAAQGLQCGADEAPLFVDIAQRAYAVANNAADPRTRIGLLRLAATAGWESGATDGLAVAEAAAADGQARCAEIPTNAFGAPRDCALLRMAPAFIAHVRAYAVLRQALATSAPDAALRAKLASAAAGYVANTLGSSERVRSRIDGDPSLHASVRAFLDRQRLTFYCTTIAFADVAGHWRLEPGRDALLRQLDPYTVAHPELTAGNCGGTA